MPTPFAEADGKERYYMKTRPMHSGEGGGMGHRQMVTRRPSSQAIETRRITTYPSYAVEEIDQEVCAFLSSDTLSRVHASLSYTFCQSLIL